uniref:DUF3800 domain-containing protein n=1 Tax=Panagrolaimus davidi TaxID=227884 RepID=A0A914PFD5_9BILA
MKLGSDFIGLSIYCDEFGAVNPLGQAAATNKMMACYFRVNNFVTELQDSNFVFLAFLAYSIDVKQDGFRELLKNLLVPQLAELENGIEVPYKGQTTVLPVILLNILGDNLGVHQMSSYTTHFAGDVSCRMCYATADEIRANSILIDCRIKTAENYDRLTNRNDCIGLEREGIKNYCIFNRLQNFHVVDAASVDMMHDLLEGHLKKLLVYVVRSLINDGITLEAINNAVTSFPYKGRIVHNKPQKFFADHIRNGEIKLSSAKTILNTTLYLPLILKQANISINTENAWYRLYLYLLHIMDNLLMPELPKIRITALQTAIEKYLRQYIDLGGHMTVKPHLLLHYTTIIKRFGSLTNSWSMAFEAKHKDFKKYERNNCNHKDLTMTLAQRHQEQNVPIYEEMAKGELIIRCTFLIHIILDDFLINRKVKKIKDYFKKGEVCVYDTEERLISNRHETYPKLGKITTVLENEQRLEITLLQVTGYSNTVHCFLVKDTEETSHCEINTLKVHRSLVRYGNYVRLPYAI